MKRKINMSFSTFLLMHEVKLTFECVDLMDILVSHSCKSRRSFQEVGEIAVR